MAKAKIINLLLDDGNLDGLLTIEDSSWDGAMFVSPRESVEKLFEQDETNYWGVYLLISETEVYIGQASDLQRRIKQHDKGKDFWKKAVLITTKDDSLNRSAIDYIEHELIEKSRKSGTLHSENKQAGNKSKVSRFDKVRYDNFIENALLLLELIGVKVFIKNSRVIQVGAKQKFSPKDNKKSELGVNGSDKNDFYIELSDGFSYHGTNNRDYFLRTIEHLIDVSPDKFYALKDTWISKKGRAYITAKQEYSSKSNTPLYSQIKDGSFVYTNQSAQSLHKNLNGYLKNFDLERIK
ncbi:GIY-YIG nuclease family protein [Lactococcus allomyrinae]|nr:GIY-YIG nuclease family protein [Lactococcus allomyrinae]